MVERSDKMRRSPLSDLLISTNLPEYSTVGRGPWNEEAADSPV